MAKENDQFVIRRSFDAPPELLFAAFTDPEHLIRWWAPKNFKMVYCKLDLRPHGMLHYCALSPEGKPAWGSFEFRKIQVGQRINFINSFFEETGSFPGWPQQTFYNVIFMEHAGSTTMIFTCEPVMKQLYNETFDQLQDYLSGINGTISKVA